MRVRRLLVPTAIALAIGGGLVAIPSQASTPSTSTLAVPASGSARIQYKGNVPGGGNPTSSCTGAPGIEDNHDVTFTVPPGQSYRATFAISWMPVANETLNDLILTVFDKDFNALGSADGSGTKEVVTLDDLPAGLYHVAACPFANAAPAGQPYDGEIVVTPRASGPTAVEPSLPSAPAGGLEFSATVPADVQRDESEPLIEVAPDGTTYTCGPTGFTTGADYAQVSTDGGDQFHLIGTGPRGQQAPGGGGDCALATSPVVNPTTREHNYAYTGLEGLLNFSVARSPDNGRTLESAPANEAFPGVDRQWMTFLDEDTVLLNYNALAPRRIVVQRSDDRGLTYGLPVTATPTPLFPGPLRTLPARFNPDGADKGPVAYFPWTTSASGSNDPRVQLSVTTDGGRTFRNCVVASDSRGTNAGFTVADHDDAGNIYVVYTDEQDYHTYLSVLPEGGLAKCTNVNANPGFTAPLQVDRGAVRSTVFPWVAAGGLPGRVAVTFYGTESQGDPNSGGFEATWHVYVSQSLNALSTAPTISQVKATTHPFHYNSICLNGLGCDLGPEPGDRSLADFFAIEFNPSSSALQIVYNQTNKRPSDAFGRVATPAVVTQVGGPSNAGGVVRDPRPVLRSSSVDPAGDALGDYSNQFIAGRQLPARATDFRSVNVGPELGANGRPVNGGGFQVTMRVEDLSNAALQAALPTTTPSSQSLLWMFRFFNGYTASAVSASWSPSAGFVFGYDDYTTNGSGVQCIGGSNNEKCQLYPQAVRVAGSVNQENGTITLTVPRRLLRGLSGPEGDKQRPAEVAAVEGTRFYDGTAFSLGNSTAATQSVAGVPTQGFLYPFDNTPAFDFRLAADAPENVIPEAPWAALLPLAGLGIAGLVLVGRRRRSARTA